MNIPFAKIDCSGNEQKYILEVLNSGWLTTAGFAAKFEQKFSEIIGGKYACAVNSCTSALHLALESVGVGRGDKVLVQSMTFTASAETIRYLGGDPVFLDCDATTRLLTPDMVKKAIYNHPEAKAIVIVHWGGQAAQMEDSDSGEGILSICKKNGVRIVEDAAHAFPATHNDKYVGTFGDVTCFSFYANKTITTGEGGMLTTNDDTIYKRIKTMRLHGINKDIWERFTNKNVEWEYDVIAPGYKYNMPDINAAIGLAQLERAFEFRKQRERCCRFYHESLKNIDGIILPEFNCAWNEHAWHIYPILIKEGSSRIDRDLFIDEMKKCGIGTSVHYKPLHRMSYYKNRYGLKISEFPNTEYLWKGTVSLPVYPGLTDLELEYICSSVSKILQNE